MGSPAEQLRLAASSGDLDQVRVLLKASTKVEPDLEGRTALHLASANGHENVVKILLESGAKVNVLDAAGYSPLHQAATEGHEEIVKLLLKSGCHVDTQDELHGNTALHEAAWKGFSRTLEILCKNKANVYIKNNGGFTPLHLTCQNGHNQCCRVLLLSACKPDVRNSYGDAPLHTAARYGHAGVLRILISAFCNVNETNKNGDSALHISAAMGRNKLTRILLEASCDQKMKNNQGEMARDIADRKEFKEVVKLLDNPPVTLIPVQERERSPSKASKKREKESGTSQESKKEKEKHKKSKKGHKVHFSDKKNAYVSPYGCHMYPDLNNFPTIKLKSLPKEPLKTGEQYYADLSGNIKKGPRGVGFMCYCAPFFNHVEKKLDSNKKELLDHIDNKNEDLKAKISHLEQRTHDQLFSLNQKMKESLALERSECTERIDRRLFRERQELEQQQANYVRSLQSDMKNILQNNGRAIGPPHGYSACENKDYHLQNGNGPLTRSKSEDLLSESNSNHNSMSYQSSAVTGASRITSNYNRRHNANPAQCGTKPKVSNHIPNVSRLRMRCMGYPELKRESRSEGDLTSCHTDTTDYVPPSATNRYANRYPAQTPFTPLHERQLRNGSRGFHTEYVNRVNRERWNSKTDGVTPPWKNGSIPNQNLNHVNQSDRSAGYQSDATKSQISSMGVRPNFRANGDPNRQFSPNNKQSDSNNYIRNQNGFPGSVSQDISSQSAQQSSNFAQEMKCNIVNTGFDADGSSFV